MPEYTLTIKFEADARESQNMVEESGAFHSIISIVLTDEDDKKL